jgi:DNA invertase Pin-like site-specific DNA recombinase
MRVIVAGRLSRKVTDRDQTGFDSQERESVRWAEGNGHDVVAVVADFKSGRSGLEARPKLRPWVSDPAKLAEYDGIVALKVDRLTRGDRAETAKLEDWAREQGKALLIAGSDVHFPSEGTEGIQWDLYLRMAHQEWLNTSERYRRMQQTRRDDGSLVGRAPYGFRIARAVNAAGRTIKTLAPEPAEAKVIEDAAAWYLAGQTLDQICDRLNDAGRLPRLGSGNAWKAGEGPRWVAKTLSGALRNETVVGRHHQGGRTLKVTPILDRKTWQRVIDRMDARATRKGISQSKTPALLTSIIVCGKHDRNMYRTGTGYYCRVKGCGAFIRLDLADQTVHDTMAGDHRRDIVETVIPGSTHEDEIAEVKRDMAEALAAEDWPKLAALQAEVDRLRALPASPPRIDRKPADKTVADMWAAAPDDNARRAYLLDRHACAVYEDGWLTVNLGQPEAE